MDTCVICNESLLNGEKTTKLQEKGSKGVNRASSLRRSRIRTQPGQAVNEKCRNTFSNPNVIEKDRKALEEQREQYSLRSQSPAFDYKTECVFCGTPATVSTGQTGKGKRTYEQVHQARTVELKITGEDTCKLRNDEWSKEVADRLAVISHLHAEAAVYHQSCSSNFRTRKNVPKTFLPDGIKRERPSSAATNAGRPHEHLTQ